MVSPSSPLFNARPNRLAKLAVATLRQVQLDPCPATTLVNLMCLLEILRPASDCDTLGQQLHCNTMPAMEATRYVCVRTSSRVRRRLPCPPRLFASRRSSGWDYCCGRARGGWQYLSHGGENASCHGTRFFDYAVERRWPGRVMIKSCTDEEAEEEACVQGRGGRQIFAVWHTS